MSRNLFGVKGVTDLSSDHFKRGSFSVSKTGSFKQIEKNIKMSVYTVLLELWCWHTNGEQWEQAIQAEWSIASLTWLSIVEHHDNQSGPIFSTVYCKFYKLSLDNALPFCLQWEQNTPTPHILGTLSAQLMLIKL